jgi:hypothetical protein
MSTLGPVARTLRIRGGYAAILRPYQDQGWTDGLPIVPPTEDDLREFLRYRPRPREVVAVLPPRQGGPRWTHRDQRDHGGLPAECFPIVITAVRR